MNKNSIRFAACIFLLAAKASAQDASTTPDTTALQQVVVSGTKYNATQKRIVQKIEKISGNRIAETNGANTGDLLLNNGNLFVQKSQMGGSSPVLRGFEANRLLLAVDGIRLNNGIYRGGHLQNSITVDQNMLENVEILQGPASTLYGSDALGGVINFTTKAVQLSTGNSSLTGLNALARYSSACNEKTLHADFNFASQKIGSLTSITVSDFGTLRAGANRAAHWQNVGLRKFSVERFGTLDSMVVNSNEQMQIGTAYKQVDAMQKFLFVASNGLRHNFNFQLSTSTDVPRYDRLSEVASNGKANWAEWYYGPQRRTLAAYKLEGRNRGGFFDAFNLGANYQTIFESRNSRRYRNDNKTFQEENVGVLGIDLNGKHTTSNNEMIIGADLQHTNVNSQARTVNIVSNAESAANARYPDGGSKYLLAGAYLQDVYTIEPNKWILNAGLRFNYVKLDGTFAGKNVLQFPFTSINQTSSAITGNLGINYLPIDDVKISLGYSSGFKAPNVDDASRVFETNNSFGLVVPNPNLKPETAHNFDFGVVYNEAGFISLAVNGFYTRLNNAMVMDRATYNGADTAVFNGVKLPVVSLSNQAYARIQGASMSAKVNFTPEFSMLGSFTYTGGTYYPNNTYKNGTKTTVPLDHIPPAFGRIALCYSKDRFSMEAWMLGNGEKNISEYNPLPASEDNAKYATTAGTPAWTTFNIRAQYGITKSLTAQLAIENLSDNHYRYFASGLSGPGRNVIAALRYKL